MAASLLTRTTDQRRWPSLLLALQRWSPRAGGLAWWGAGLLLALLVTVPAWLPWTSPDLNLLWEEAKGTDDAKHHMLRLYLFEWLTQRGVWYPRWAPDLFMGYGYPVFNYYAPGVYYTGLALRALLRQDVWDAYRSTGVLAALLGASGTFALVVAVWRRLALGVLAASAVLYGPYVFQTTLFQRGAVPEALGLALLPWLPFGAWQTWRATTPGRQGVWLVATALATAALLLTHSLVAAAGLAITLAWAVALLLLLPNRAALGRLALALLLGAGLAAPFWLPAAGESGAVQLEVGREGHLDARAWLLDLGGQSEKQQAPENRQTRAGPLDLHLLYPHQHQFVVTLKPSLAQAGLVVLALLALLLCRGAARRQALLASPFLLLALACWALLFSFSEPVWRLVPALSLLQWPGRLLGPFGYCVAIAGAGGLGALWTLAEGRSPSWGRAGGWALAGTALGLVLLNGWGGREVPLYPDPKRTMDGRMIVQEEKDSFSHIGTTSGGEFTPADVQIAVYTAGQRRGRAVFERLYPEREWTGGLFQPLSGDLRFLGWQQAPLRLSVRLVNDSPEPARLGVRQFRFPGWRAWVDGRRIPVDVAPRIPEQQAALGFIVLTVPPGEHTLNLALGPTPWRASGMALAVFGGVGLAVVLLLGARRARVPLPASLALLGVCLLTLLLLAYGSWRGLRPAFGRFAVPPAPPAAPVDGVFGRSPPPPGSGALLVNLAAAARNGQARVSSPSGAVLGPEQFVDVRYLTVVDSDPDRGAAGASRREWLYLHPPSEVAVDLAVPREGPVWLQSLLALDPRAWDAPQGDGVRFLATVTPLTGGQAGQAAAVIDRTLNPRAEDAQRRWVPVEADLSPWGGETVRLTLRTLPVDDLAYDWAGWGDPVVALREFARVRPAG